MNPTFFSLIIGFIFGIVGSFIGACFTHFFSERRRRAEIFEKTATDFWAAFLPEFLYLKHDVRTESLGTNTNLFEILSNAYVSRHLGAFETFRGCLPSGKQGKFDEAWKDYCHYDVEGEPSSPFFEQYLEETWEGQSTRDLAMERIEKLLGFARA